MIALFLLLVIAAIALGIVGVVAKGLLFLLMIGIVVFLGALKTSVETAGALQDLTADQTQAADVVESEEHLGRPFRLQAQTVSCAGRGNTIFIAINQVVIGMPQNVVGHFGERVRREQVGG